MSKGRDKLGNFSLLKSLIHGDSERLQKKTSRMKKATQENNSKQHTKRSNNKSRSVQRCRNDFMRIPQYGTHINKQTLQELEKNNLSQQDEIVITIDIEKEKQKIEKNLFRWLCNRFPKCFNPLNKIPLKIGISDEIEIIYQNENLQPIDKLTLINVLRRYVGDTRYHKSVFELRQRFDLQGKAVEDFSEEHIEHAKFRLNEIVEKAELRAKGISIKEYYEEKRVAKEALKKTNNTK